MRNLEVKTLLKKAVCVAVAAALVAAPLAASAQTNNQAVVPITGTGPNGTPFTGTFHVQRFEKIANRIYAIGLINGNLGSQAVVDQAAAIPVILGPAHGRGEGRDGEEQGSLVPQPGIQPAFASLSDRPLVITTQTCPILHLTLGPLDLNLLGLLVHLNQVVLNIDAQQGGGLLGDLLCGVANLLNGLNLSGLLNNLLGALNTLGL